MNHVRNNPHLKDSIQLARESGLELGREDYRSAHEHKPVKCDCGSTLWWKPTVGAYVCRGCCRVGLPAGRCPMCGGSNCMNPHA
jgi:hypothetical protein